MSQSLAETAAAYLSGVDLTGLAPEQALRLGQLTAELLELSEAFGYRKAITALRDKDGKDAAAFKLVIETNPRDWDGWPYSHPYRESADYLEAIAEEGK